MRAFSPSRRTGFTLVEMAVVILVILILLTLTVALVGDVMDGDRVKGASRQVQNFLAGARDRAIYAANRQEGSSKIPPAIGVRFLPDPGLNQAGVARAFGSMVFVRQTDPLRAKLRVVDPATGEVSQLKSDGTVITDDNGNPEPSNHAVGALIDRGLLENTIGTQYRLAVYFNHDLLSEPYFVDFDAATNLANPDVTGDSQGDWLAAGFLSKALPLRLQQSGSDLYDCSVRLLPSPMPSEEPRILPPGAVIDVQSSLVGGSPLLSHKLFRSDGSFDVMFNAHGVVDGPLAADGLIHLVVADARDIERGFRITGPFVNSDATPYLSNGTPAPADSDSDGNPDERQGDVRIVSLRTQTGSAYASSLNPAPSPSNSFVYGNPFAYAINGGEAK